MVGHAVFGSWRERVKNVLNPESNSIDKKFNFNYLYYNWSKLVVFVNIVWYDNKGSIWFQRCLH